MRNFKTLAVRLYLEVVLQLYMTLKCYICSLMVNMLNAPKEVRAASLRVMKHLIVDEESLELFLDLHLDYIVAR